MPVSQASKAGKRSRSAVIQLLRMPEFSRIDIQEYVRSRKFIHIGRISSISHRAGRLKSLPVRISATGYPSSRQMSVVMTAILSERSRSFKYVGSSMRLKFASETTVRFCGRSVVSVPSSSWKYVAPSSRTTSV